MPAPLSLCLESTNGAPGAQRFLRCVAVPGRQPGLRLGADGAVHWRDQQTVACELWVSADDQLMLFRPDGAAPVTVSRAGRSLEVPFEKPVVLLDGDCLEVSSRIYRLHFHGATRAIKAPEPVGRVSRRVKRLSAAAIGTAILVRCAPPEPPYFPGDAQVEDAGTPDAEDGGTAGTPDSAASDR